jgi:hypothetical protein
MRRVGRRNDQHPRLWRRGLDEHDLHVGAAATSNPPPYGPPLVVRQGKAASTQLALELPTVRRKRHQVQILVRSGPAAHQDLHRTPPLSHIGTSTLLSVPSTSTIAAGWMRTPTSCPSLALLLRLSLAAAGACSASAPLHVGLNHRSRGVWWGRTALRHERCQRVGGAPVQGMTRSVIAAGGARVGVSGGVLDVAERDPSVQRQGHHRVSQAVRDDVLAQPRPGGPVAPRSWRRRGGPAGPRCSTPAAGRRRGHRAPRRSRGRSVGPTAPACAARPCRPPSGPDASGVPGDGWTVRAARSSAWTTPSSKPAVGMRPLPSSTPRSRIIGIMRYIHKMGERSASSRSGFTGGGRAKPRTGGAQLRQVPVACAPPAQPKSGSWQLR